MALIRTSALIADITGRIAGSCFQRSQGGLIMRAQRAQRNSNTNAQQFQKVGINEIMLTWTSLTQAQRDQWNQYAIYRNIKQKKNPTRSISGHQIFIRENSLRYSMKDFGAIFINPIHSTPLLAQPLLPLSVTEVFNDGGAMFITYDRVTDGATEAPLFWISAPITESRQSRYVKRAMIKTDSITADSQEVTDSYLNTYGNIPLVGQFVSIEIGLYGDAVKTYSRSTPQLIIVSG